MAAALVIILLLGGWEAYARLGSIDDFILPAPDQVASSLFHDRGLLWDNLLVTAQEVVLGLALALAAGALLASPCTASARCAARSTRCWSARRRSRSSRSRRCWPRGSATASCPSS